MIHLDTSLLVDALSGARRSAPALRRAIEQGERIAVSALVLFEWLRGPRLEAELAAQEAILPAEQAVPFGTREAALAAQLFRTMRRARGREIDLAVAACALTQDALLWTLNPKDFEDIPGLVLFAARQAGNT